MAKGDFNNKRNTKGFDKNPQNINRKGANRKSISSVNKDLEDKGYKTADKKDILDCYLRLINIDLNELKALVSDDTQPALVRIVGKAILSGKGFDVIEKVLDRGIGKPEQKIEQNNTHALNDFDIAKLYDKET